MDRLWYHDSKGWQYHPYIPSRSWTQFFYSTGCDPNGGPNRTQLRRSVVLHRNNRLLLAGYDMETEVPQQHRGLDVLRHSPMARDWNLTLKTVGSLSALIEDIRNGHRYIVSDGSYRNDAGAAAWIIEGRSAAVRIIGMMITPGYTMDHSSFRSELTGIYGALCTLESLELGIAPFSCRIVCNGKSALDRIQSVQPVLPTEPHADLLQVIRSKLSRAIRMVRHRQFYPMTHGSTLKLTY